MKTSLMIAAGMAALLSATCCTKTGLNPTKSRAECSRGPSRHSRPAAGIIPEKLPATLLYSTVSFSGDYDWQKDTAYGMLPFTIRLFRNGEEIVRADCRAGGNISANPGTHHIIDGHLYTERQGPSGTVICRDGEEVIRLRSREILKGLLPAEDGIYSLSQEEDEGRMTFRRNGEVINSFPRGHIFGGLDDVSYPQYGALYRSAGKICFVFLDRQALHAVTDGEDRTQPCAGMTVEDARIMDGRLQILDLQDIRQEIEDGRLFDDSGTLAVCGVFRQGAEKVSGILKNGNINVICQGEATVYPWGSSSMAVEQDGHGMLNIWKSGGEKLLGARGRLMDAGCFSAAGAFYAVGISPLEKGGRPQIIQDGRTTELDFNGYVSCVRVSPPRK